jgi:hypothetical protein
MTALKSLLYLLAVQNFGFYVPLALCRSGTIIRLGGLTYLAFVLWPLGVLGVI